MDPIYINAYARNNEQRVYSFITLADGMNQ